MATVGVLAGIDTADERPVRLPDRLGLLACLAGGLGTSLLPLLVFKANRIAAGDPLRVTAALPPVTATILLLVLAAAGLVVLFVRNPVVRLAAAVTGLVALTLAVGHGATTLVADGERYARVALGGAFWVLLVTLALLVTDAMARLRFGPLARIAALAITAAAVAALFASGSWNDLSVMREYASRSTTFWREAERHVLLSVGSLAAAALVGLPLGVLAHRRPRLRAAMLQTLNLIQTIPSIALFGILMAPLGYLAANVPLAAALGIRGIGVAPALLALFLYALLPVVANTVIGLGQVAPAVVDAARGMGLTDRQILTRIELPLAFPVILTGIRIVLVQSIGLVTVAALIGGGGFGTFVFQGIGQTAMDLVLLGAIPTVALAFAAAVLLDAAVDFSRRGTP
ncbi:MAG: ABC transporter permease [Geminicoccaceae bacterium]